MHPKIEMGVNLKQLRKGCPKCPERPCVGCRAAQSIRKRAKLLLIICRLENPKIINEKNGKMRTEMARPGMPIRYENGSTLTKNHKAENSGGSEGGEKSLRKNPKRELLSYQQGTGWTRAKHSRLALALLRYETSQKFRKTLLNDIWSDQTSD